MMNFYLSAIMMVIFSSLLMVGCDKKVTTTEVSVASTDSTDSETEALLAANTFPRGLALAATFSTTTSAQGLVGDSKKISKTKKRLKPRDGEAFDTTQSFEEKAAALEEIVTATDATVCQITLPSSAGGTSPTCYGPTVDYQNHPNAGTTSDADDVPADPGNPNQPGEDDGILPSGDLGLWTATDSTTSNACAAAKVNSLITDLAAKVDSGLLLAASMVCVLNTSATALPAETETVDITTDVNTAIAINNTGVTVSAATIERLTDVDTNPIYVYTITYALNNGMTFDLKLKHMPTDADNTVFKGKLWGSIVNSNQGQAYSMLYEKTDSVLNYKLVSGNYNADVSDPHPTTLFTEGGNLVIDNTLNGNIVQSIASLDPITGLGNMNYAWQAGSGDNKTRVFNAFTKANADDATKKEGCGFFGYGNNFDTSTGEVPDNSIGTFICNWAGPGNNHNGLVGFAQKQCMLENSEGVFAEIAEKQAITYAPTTTCDFDGTSTNSSTRPFNWALSTGGGPQNMENYGSGYDDTVAHVAVTNNLVELSADEDFSEYTAPTAPTDFE